ncbi:YjzD family protein [Weissella coleopterorum]|uniref:YjzD family protein n=1 Tax=Weissella coleopterorum TaxID=2714949 RepID=A0A6G8B0J9_9LACO|nr:YjzD family protein [Weissella coleopterorum]QIL50834.1 YjzD family protein [Weissella coleopterorum]
MKYITTFFWTAILGAVIGYIGGALQNVEANYTQAMVTALIAGSIGTILVYYISRSNAPKVSKTEEDESEKD